jgi:hypothetical protein
MHDLATISAADLERVTGGATPANTRNGNCTTLNDSLLATLQGIQSSLNNLGNNNNNGLFGGNNALLFMTMALCMQRRDQVVVYGGGRCGGWYSWRY